MWTRLALTEDQVAVLVERKRVDPSQKNTSICDFACYPLCKSKQSHRMHTISVICYEVVDEAPFKVMYRKHRSGGVQISLPVIPVGENGDSILRRELVEWMKSATDAVKLDPCRAIGFVRSKFYIFDHDERIEQLHAQLLEHDHLVENNTELFEPTPPNQQWIRVSMEYYALAGVALFVGVLFGG
jgi:hypothetical protein